MTLKTDREGPSEPADARPSPEWNQDRTSGTGAREANGVGDKILLLEGETSSRRALEDLLLEAGYEVTSSDSCHRGFQFAREIQPDVILLDEALAGLACGDVLAELKSGSSTKGLRVILLVSGAAPERVHALDLGADDVLSRPFDPHELQARIRVQLRLKRTEDELRDRLRIVEESEQVSHAAMVVTEKASREASGLRSALKVGGVVLLVALLVMGGLYYRFSRRTTSEVQRNYAAVAALSHRLANQQDLIERVRILSGQMKAASSSTAESSLAERIIKDYTPSVCLIYAGVIFRDAATRRFLRYATTADGNPVQDLAGNPQLTLDGKGPEVRMDVLGTGFQAGQDGRILTNRHVAEPWWRNDELTGLTNQGLEPAVAAMRAYFPGATHAYTLSTVLVSSGSDLALLHTQIGVLKRKTLPLDGGAKASLRGEPIVLMGYATGLDALLAGLGDATIKEIATETKGDLPKVLDRMAERDLIRPLITQGHLGDVRPDRIVYDAQTAAGGSGGPVFNLEGKVIGVNHAVLEGFGGSNFGVPARFAETLLAR
jgi:serine protease Do